MSYRSLFAVVVVLAAVSSADADNRVWINPSGGPFGLSGLASPNWSTTDGGPGFATVPGPGDVANFTLGGAYTVSFPTLLVDTTNQVLRLSGDVTFDLSGRTYLLTEGSPQGAVAVSVGRTPSQTARLTITNGTLDVDGTGDWIQMPDANFSSAFLTVSTNGRLGDGATNPTLILGGPGPGTLIVNSNGQVNAQQLRVGSGAVAVTGPQATLTAQTVSIGFSLGGLGSFTVESGSTVSSGNVEAGTSSSVGTITVTGTGSTWSINGDLRLSGDPNVVAPGTGVLNVEPGGTVHLVSATGTVRFWSGGTVNVNGGTLNVVALDNRGGVLNFNTGTIGFFDNKTLTRSDLTMLLGTDTTLRPGRTLRVYGAATLNWPLVLDGGTFTVGSLTNPSALDLRSGTFSLTTGTFTPRTLGISALAVPLGLNINVTNDLTVPSGDHLAITGGQVSAGSMTNDAGGRITLDGLTARLASAGTLTNSGVITGNGTVSASLANNAGGEIRPAGNGGLVFAGATNANSGEINLNNGTIEFINAFTNTAVGMIAGRGSLAANLVTNNGVIALSGGLTDIYGDVVNKPTGNISIGGGANVTFYDDLTQNGAFVVSRVGSTTSVATLFGAFTGGGFTGGGDVFVLGDLRPGNSPAQVTYDGNLFYGPSASTQIELGGTTPGAEHDQLVITGQAALAGTLVVDLINGFAPTLPGQSFAIMNYSSHTGTFNAIAGQPSAALPGLFWTVAYTPTSAILSTSAIPGDINLDGTVNRRDAALFTPHLGTIGGAIWTTGDFDFDGKTTLGDLGLLQANLVGSVQSTAGINPAARLAAVPEPATWTLAVLGLACFVCLTATRRGARLLQLGLDPPRSPTGRG